MAFSSKLELRRTPDKTISYPSHHDLSKLATCEIYSRDVDKDRNIRVISKVANANCFKAIQFDGFTCFLGYKYQFPIYCSRQEFIRFLKDVKDHEDRRTLFECGILTTNMYNDFPYVWKNLFSGPLCDLGPLRGFYIYRYNIITSYLTQLFVFMFILIHLFGLYDLQPFLTIPMFGFFMNLNNVLTPFVLQEKLVFSTILSTSLCAIGEELIKRHVPLMSWYNGIGFAIWEVFHKHLVFREICPEEKWRVTFISFIPISMHLISGSLPLFEGSIFHILWNLIIPRLYEWLTAKVLCSRKLTAEEIESRRILMCRYKLVSDLKLYFHRRYHELPLVFVDHENNYIPLRVNIIIDDAYKMRCRPYLPSLKYYPTSDQDIVRRWNNDCIISRRYRFYGMATTANTIFDNETMEAVQDTSFILDVVVKLVKGDILGLTLSAGMQAIYLRDLLAILSLNDYEELAKEFNSSEETVMLSGEASSVYKIFSSLVPDFVSKSPFSRKVFALVVLLVTLPITQDLPIIQRFSKLIAWDTLPDGGSIVDITLAALKAVYDAYFRVTETGDWRSIFGLHEDVKFIKEARECLLTTFSEADDETVLKHMKRVNDLIDSRALKWNEGMIGTMISKLTDHVKQIQIKTFDVKFIADVQELQREICPKYDFTMMQVKLKLIRKMVESRKYLHNDANINKMIQFLVDKEKQYAQLLMDCRVRRHPFVFNLMGVPGFGKTVLINAIIELVMRLNNYERFVGDVLKYRPASQWPCESGIHKCAHILEANDLHNNWTNSASEGVEPLDVFYQRFIDTSPFEIDAAFDKGIILSDLKYGIITSNFKEFVGAYPAMKLRRRFNVHAVNAWCYFEGHPNEQQIEEMPLHVRNSLARFEILTCHVKDKDTPNWNFQPIWKDGKKVVLNLPEFLKYCTDKVKEHDEREDRMWKLFNDPKSICPCGVPYVMHFVDSEDPENFTQITPTCRNLIDAPIVESETLVEEEYMIGADYFNLNFWTILALFLGYQYFVLWLKYFHSLMLEEMHKVRAQVVQTSAFPPLYKQYLKRFGVEEFEDLDMVCKMYAFSSRVRAYTIIHKRKIQLLCGVIASGALCAYLMKRYDPELIGKPIYRENVDPSSMNLMEPVRVQRWTAEQRRDWGKVDEDMIRFVPVKVGVGLADLKRIMKRAVRVARMTFEIDGKLKGVDRNIVFWSAQWCSMNKHFLPKGVIKFSLEIEGAKQAFEFKDLIYSDKCESYFIPNLFDATCFPLYEMLPKSLGKGEYEVYSTLGEFQGLGKVTNFHSSFDDINYTGIAWQYNGMPGDCGNLLAINTGDSWCVSGFVAASASAKQSWLQVPITVTIASLLDRSIFDGIISKDPYPFVVKHELSDVEMIGIGELSVKADIRHINSPFLIPIGTTDDTPNTFHTKFQRTKLYDDFAPLLSEPYDAPKKIRGMNDMGEYNSAFLRSFNVLTSTCEITYSEFENAMIGYLDDAIPIEYVKEKNISLRPMSEMEATFGDPQIGVDRINFSTSCGPDWTREGIKDKTQLFEELDNSEWELRLMAKYQDRLVRLRNKIASHVLPFLKVKFAVKDEVRKVSKLIDYAIRLFSVVNFEFNHFMRMLLMPVVSFLLNHPMLSECYGGINAGSKQWHQLAQHLRKFDHFIDMDFKTFDNAHRLIIIIIVANFFYKATKRLGYTEEEAEWSYLIVRSLCVQFLIFNNDVMIKMFGLPSGIIITLIMNSIVNSILMRVAFVRLTGKEVQRFKEFVAAATTGDDNASGISSAIIDQFNMITIREVYLKAGYQITSARKDDLIQKTIPFEQLDFLKRKFVFDKRVDMFVAPISKDSIWKSLCFQNKELGVSPMMRLCQCAESAQREAWLHGDSFLQEVQTRLKESFVKHQMALGYRELSSEKLLSEFHDGTFKTFMC